MTVKQFEKTYGPGGQFKDYESAMNTTYDDYGPYLQGHDLTYIGAYARALWLTPEKLIDEQKKCLQRTFKRAEKWAKMRADFRI